MDSLEAETRRKVAELDAANERWMIVYGCASRQVVAFPLFRVPPLTFVVVMYPEALPRRLREIEQAYIPGHARVQPSALGRILDGLRRLQEMRRERKMTWHCRGPVRKTRITKRRRGGARSVA